MEITHKGLHAFRGFSDDPMLSQQELENFEEENRSPKENLSPKDESNKPPFSPSEDIVIDFSLEGGTPIISQREPQSQEQGQGVINNLQEEICEEDEQVDPQYIQAVQSIIKRCINTVLKWNTVSAFVIITLLFTMKWKSAYVYTFLLISFVDIYGLLNLLQNKPQESLEKQRYYMNILQKTLSVLAKLGLVCHVYITPFPLSYAFAPTLFFDFCFAAFLATKYRKHILKNYYNVQLFFKGFSLVLIGCIVLRLDNLIKWHWREVFLSFWIFYGIMIGFSLIITLAFFDKFLNFFLPERRNYEVFGLLWLALIAVGTSVLSCLIVIKLQRTLDNNLEKSIAILENFSSVLEKNGLSILLIITAVYNISIIFYTTTHFQKIEKFFKKVTVIEDESRPRFSSDSTKVTTKQAQSPTKLIIPRFLARSSNTFFRRVTQDDIDKSKQKSALKSNKAIKKKVKQIQNLQRNSFDTKGQQRKLPLWLADPGLTSNGDLNTIPETEREKIELTARGGRPPALKKLPEMGNLGLTSLATDRSRAGLLLSSTRSGINSIADIHSGQNSPTALSARQKRTTTGDENGQNPLLILRQTSGKLEEDPCPTERERRKIIDEDEESPKALTKRRANSLLVIPEVKQVSIAEVTEYAEAKESSKADISVMASSFIEASAVQNCLICFDKAPDAVFMECGHGGVCYECSLEIWKTTTECYLCRKMITQVLQIDSQQKIGKDIIKVISATQMVVSKNQQQPPLEQAN